MPQALRAAERMLALTQGSRPTIWSSASSPAAARPLLTLPADGILHAGRKQRINKELLASPVGADHYEMNCVRKHLSRIKGGRLAAACAPARGHPHHQRCAGDDPPSLPAALPVPDASTCADALAILDRYRITVPPPCTEALEAGAFETNPATPCFAGRTVPYRRHTPAVLGSG